MSRVFCNRKIFDNGTLVMTTHSIPTDDMEEWVREVAKQSKQPVDWHFAGGRACVIATGNLDQVRTTIRSLLPEHDELQRRATEKMNIGEGFLSQWKPSCTLYDEGEVNLAYCFVQQLNKERQESA